MFPAPPPWAIDHTTGVVFFSEVVARAPTLRILDATGVAIGEFSRELGASGGAELRALALSNDEQAR